MARRVFLITRNRMKVFEWHGKTLFASCEFKSTEEGSSAFAEYIQSVDHVTSQILVELLEEEFERDTIPHLHGKDKRMLMDRAVNRHYANNEFTYSQVCGRKTTGRKDDEILVASISNAEPLYYWLDQLNNFAVPICGIWSLPIISQQLVKVLEKKLGQKDENILLVSRQMRSTVRESFFRKDKMLLSRQVKIERNLRHSDHAESYFTHGAEQIYKFLTNQRIMAYGSPLAIYSVLPHRLISEAREKNLDTEELTNYFFDIEDLYKHYRLNIDDEVEADVLYAYLCSTRSVHSDHYGTTKEKLPFKKYAINRSIFLGCAVSALFLFGAAGFFAVSSYEINNQRKTVDASTNRLANYYADNFSEREIDINIASRLQQTVEFQNLLAKESALTLEQFFIPLSSVYSQTRFSKISLHSIRWDKMYGTELNKEKAAAKDVATSKDPTPDEEQYYDEVLEVSEKVPVVRIRGRVDRSTDDYARTVSLITMFSEALREMPLVDSVYLVRIPVDTRRYSEFADEQGLITLADSKDDEIDSYEIVIFLNGVDDQSGLGVTDV